jgi:hypothetical protein
VYRLNEKNVNLSNKERQELFQATAINMAMRPEVIEKDFWVYYSFIYNASCGYEKLINDVKINLANHGCVVSDALNNSEVEEDEIEL